MYIFRELLDCILDILALASLFVPKVPKTYKSSSFSVHMGKEIVQMILKLLDSLTESEAYDLVDVDCNNVKVFIKSGNPYRRQI